MGTPEFAVPSLRKLSQSAHEMLCVVTRPDRRSGRGRRLTPPPVKRAARSMGLEVFQPERLTDPSFLATLQRMKPDLLVVVAFVILPKKVFSIPERGSVNLHASLLPQYRGAAPINWAIINGETETGLTTFLLDSGMDTGDLLLQRRISIGEDETAGQLHDRFMEIGADLLLETVEGLEAGRLFPRPQPSEDTSRAPKLSKEDGRIDWRKEAPVLRNLIRGTNPFPGAFTIWRGQPLKVHRAEVSPGLERVTPGEVLEVDPRRGITVQTGKGALRLLEVQPYGKRSMPAVAFLRGYKVSRGEILGG